MRKWLIPLFLLVGTVAAHADSIVVQNCRNIGLTPLPPGSTRLDTIDIYGTKCTSSLLPITGGEKVELLPAAKLRDTFNSPSTLDTVNWATPTTSGTGASATYTQGQEQLSSGTAAGAYALLTSNPTFPINSPGFLLWRGAINTKVAETVNTCKEMGLFLKASSPTCAAPVTEGVLFEITIAGKLQAVTYAGGARTLIADLSLNNNPFTSIWPAIVSTDGTNTVLCPQRFTPQPADTCPHIFDIWFNGNSAEFDVDFQPVAFMKVGSLGPNNNLLPWSAMTINSGSASATTLLINQAVVGDEAHNSFSTCDPNYSFQCAGVTAGGNFLPSLPNTPLNGNATGSTGAVVGTLTATATTTAYICGFNVQAIGGTAVVGPITVAGLSTSQVYQASSSAAGGTVASQNFWPCLPASAVNTNITVTTTADGTATAVDVNSWGFRQ